MIKITHIVTAYISVVTILDSKLRGLSSYNDLDVMAISSPPDFEDSRKPSIRHIPVKMARSIKPLADLKSIWRLYRILKKEKPDVVHSHTAKAGFITTFASKMAKVPVICHTYHGLPFFEGQNKKTYHIYRFLEKLVCKFRNYIFTQNKRDLPECVKLIGSEEKVLFEGNGIDIESIKRSAAKQLGEAKQYYPEGNLKLLLLSRFEPVKRIPDFLGVVQKLLQDGIKVSCIIAGGGIQEEMLRNQIDEMGLDKCVRLLGFTDRPHALIQECDITVLCSEKEGIPRSLMEAMALQKPVVATDVLGTQELVEDGHTGFLAPLGDTSSMAEKIKLLADDKEMRVQMGFAGQKRVSEYFNDIKIAESLYEFYNKSVSSK